MITSNSPPGTTTPTVPPPVWQTLRRFPRPVWFLFLGTFINRFGTFVIPFLALHLSRLGFSTRQASLALGAYGVGHLIASAVGGHLADTIGRRKTIVLSMLCGAACMLLLSQAQSLPLLLALAFLTGMTGEFYKPASSALLADLTPESHRVTAYAAYRFAINAGFAFGPAVAGFLAHYSYFWLFLGDAATSAIYGLVALLFLPRDEPRDAPGWSFVLNAAGSLREAGRMAAGNPRFLRLMLASFAAALVFMQMPSTLGLQIKAAGFPDEIYGLVLALNGVLIVLFEIPLTTFTQRLAPRPVIAAGFALTGLGGLCYVWADSPWEYACGMTVLTLGEMLSMPVAMAYVARLAPAAMRGRFMGIYSLTWAAALACGPSLGLVVFAWKPELLWLACGAVGLLAAAIVGRVPRTERVVYPAVVGVTAAPAAIPTPEPPAKIQRLRSGSRDGDSP